MILGVVYRMDFYGAVKGDRVADEETIAMVQARGDGGLDLSGGVEVGRGGGIEIYSILEEESYQTCRCLGCGMLG